MLISEKSSLEAVVYNNKMSAFSEPDEFSTRLFEVNEGLKVKVQEIKKNWLKIELLDGKIGWIEKKYLRIIK